MLVSPRYQLITVLLLSGAWECLCDQWLSPMSASGSYNWISIVKDNINKHDYEVKANGSIVSDLTLDLNFRYKVASDWLSIDWKWTMSASDSLLHFKMGGSASFMEREGCLFGGTFNIAPSTSVTPSIWRFGKDSAQFYVLRDGEIVGNVSRASLACLDEEEWEEIAGTYIKVLIEKSDTEASLFYRRVCSISEDADENSLQCVKCVEGTVHADAEGTECIACRAGTYKTSDMTNCSPCPAYAFSTEGSASCTNCSEGTAPNEQRTSCQACSAGTFRTSDMAECEPCPINTMSPVGATKCSKCPAGTFSDFPTKCDNCGAGTYRTSDMTACERCPVNTISSEKATSCTECPEGTGAIFKRTECVCSLQNEHDKVYGDYVWGNVVLGEMGELPCFHDFNDKFMARKFCSEDGIFSKTDYTDCTTSATNKLDDLAKKTENSSMSQSDADTLSQLFVEASEQSGDELSSNEVMKATEIMESLLSQGDQNTTRSELFLDNMIDSIDNIQRNAGSGQIGGREVSSKLRDVSVAIASNLVRGSDPTKVIMKESIGFGVARKEKDKNVLTLAGDKKDGSADTDDVYFAAELETPEDMVATAVFHQSDKLFPSNLTWQMSVSGSSEEEEKTAYNDLTENIHEAEQEVAFVATIITDINIIDTKTLQLSNSGLEQNISMNFAVTDFASKVHTRTKRKNVIHHHLACKFYNITLNDWSEQGCETRTVYNEEKGVYDVTCLCDHLTSFAVLMSFSSESNEGEESATLILLSGSLVCLVLTLLATLPIKQQRRREHSKVNMMLTTSLILSISVFFLMDSFVSTEPVATTPCLIIAFLLNYFWLCQLGWMVVEAVTMYKALVRVFGTAIDNALLKYCLGGWGVPIIFPLIGLAWGNVSQYADPKTCFVRYPYGLASFYGPVVLGVLTIWAMFFSIARVIMTASAAKAKSKGDSTVTLRRRQLLSSFAVSTLLGLGWIVGFFLLMNNSNYGQINTVMRWAFILLNAPQGIFIFVMYVLMSKKIRGYWIDRLLCRQSIDPDVTGVSLAYTTHSTADNGLRMPRSPVPAARSPKPSAGTRLTTGAPTHGRGRTPSPCRGSRNPSPRRGSDNTQRLRVMS